MELALGLVDLPKLLPLIDSRAEADVLVSISIVGSYLYSCCQALATMHAHREALVKCHARVSVTGSETSSMVEKSRGTQGLLAPLGSLLSTCGAHLEVCSCFHVSIPSIILLPESISVAWFLYSVYFLGIPTLLDTSLDTTPVSLSFFLSLTQPHPTTPYTCEIHSLVAGTSVSRPHRFVASET